MMCCWGAQGPGNPKENQHIRKFPLNLPDISISSPNFPYFHPDVGAYLYGIEVKSHPLLSSWWGVRRWRWRQLWLWYWRRARRHQQRRVPLMISQIVSLVLTDNRFSHGQRLRCRTQDPTMRQDIVSCQALCNLLMEHAADEGLRCW